MKADQEKDRDLERSRAELEHMHKSQALMEPLNTQLKTKSVELVKAETTIEFLEKEIKELRKKVAEYEDILKETFAHVRSSSKQPPTSRLEVSSGECMT